MTRQELINKRLKEYLAAEEAVLLGQSYQIGGRSLTRANLATIRKAIEYLIEQGGSVDESEQTRAPCYIKRVVMIDA